MPETVTQSTQQAPAMSGQEAHAILTNEALYPLCFAKLAEYGRQPANEEEAQALTQMFSHVLMAREQGLLQSAGSGGTSVVKRAAARLANHIGQAQPRLDPAAEDDAWAKNAAAHAMQAAPRLHEAAVAYQVALMAPQQ